jgi:hypothetical protein
MKPRAAATVLVVLGAALLGACRDARQPSAGSAASAGNHTAVLGGFGGPPPSATAGQGIPPPPGVPAQAKAQVVQSGPDAALAVWLQDGNVVAASYTKAAGWAPAQPLEEIFGEDSDPQLASNGQGSAMAVWRHTVGSIESLRYSRFDTAGWSVPDVMPGALPRPRTEQGTAPQLKMDAQGQVVAEWRSGFDPAQTQSARYVPGQGWSHATNGALASAAPASPAPPQPSSAQ